MSRAVPSGGGCAKNVHTTGAALRVISGAFVRYSSACWGCNDGRVGKRYEETRCMWGSCRVSYVAQLQAMDALTNWFGTCPLGSAGTL